MADKSTIKIYGYSHEFNFKSDGDTLKESTTECMPVLIISPDINIIQQDNSVIRKSEESKIIEPTDQRSNTMV